MLDHIVASGQPVGLSLMENVVKECGEEAGIPPELARMTRPAGAINYESYEGPHKSMGEGWISRMVLFCFDLSLPPDFGGELLHVGTGGVGKEHGLGVRGSHQAQLLPRYNRLAAAVWGDKS